MQRQKVGTPPTEVLPAKTICGMILNQGELDQGWGNEGKAKVGLHENNVSTHH